MSFKAILKIDGKYYNLLDVTYSFRRFVDYSGYVTNLIRFEKISLVISSPADTFFLHWMFAPTLQKSGTISFYDDEDMEKKIRQVVFAGAFCINYQERFHINSNKQFQANITLSAGGVKIQESTFRFPWFKGPLEAPVEIFPEIVIEEEIPKPIIMPVASAAVEKPARPPEPEIDYEGLAKSLTFITTKDPRLDFPPSSGTNYSVKKEDIVIEEMVLGTKETHIFKLWDKNSGAKIGNITMPTRILRGGPELSIHARKAKNPKNGDEKNHDLRSVGFSWTSHCLDLIFAISLIKFKAMPLELPAHLAHDNLANFQKEYVLIRDNPLNEGLQPEQIAQLAVRKISYGIHRIAKDYKNFSFSLSAFQDVTIKDITYLNVPTEVHVKAFRDTET